MTTYTTRVIDGTTAQAGGEWPHLTGLKIEADSADEAADKLEAMIRADRIPAGAYNGDASITVTLIVEDDDTITRRVIEVETA